MEAVRKLDAAVREHGAQVRRTCWGTGLIPQVPVNDKKMYPIYAKCVELDIPIFVVRGRARAAHPVRAAGRRRCSTRCAGSSPS